MHFLPDDLPALQQRLQGPHPELLVVCYCAAWCKTCTAYQPLFTSLSSQYPHAVFVWVDVEENEELLGDADVDDFPTLLVQNSAGTLFFGSVLPHIEHLQRLLDHAAEMPVLTDTGPGQFTDLVAAATK